MPENDENVTAENAGESKQAKWNAPASQEELDRIVQDRLARERAKYADYEAIKAKAAELDQLRDSEKTELERKDAEIEQLRRQAAEAEERRQQSELEALIARVAADKGVPAHRISGTTQQELEADADKYLTEINAKKKPFGYVPTSGMSDEGNLTQGSVASGRERARADLGVTRD